MSRIEDEIIASVLLEEVMRSEVAADMVASKIRQRLEVNGYGKLPQPLDDKELREKIARVLCDSVADTYSKDRDFTWEQIGVNERNWFIAAADLILALLQPKIAHLIDQLKLADKNYTDLKSAIDERIEEARRQGIIELGKRLKKVRDESYDEQTFRIDLNELTKLAVKGKILPKYVVKCVGVIFKNPKFNPRYAKPHQYEHSGGYPKNKHICVCGLEKTDKMHTALILH